mmetsp:Transcript_118811/g.331456  ORF Transcript_118811/g.331456 Transcript_118811/m.331456 type:complete len:328 (-) Transcript_118811:499-1482(-)
MRPARRAPALWSLPAATGAATARLVAPRPPPRARWQRCQRTEVLGRRLEAIGGVGGVVGFRVTSGLLPPIATAVDTLLSMLAVLLILFVLLAALHGLLLVLLTALALHGATTWAGGTLLIGQDELNIAVSEWHTHKLPVSKQLLQCSFAGSVPTAARWTLDDMLTSVAARALRRGAKSNGGLLAAGVDPQVAARGAPPDRLLRMVGAMLKLGAGEVLAASFAVERLQSAPHPPVDLAPREAKVFVAVPDVAANVPVLARDMLRKNVAVEVDEHGSPRADSAGPLIRSEEATTEDAEGEHAFIVAEKLLQFVRKEAACKLVMAVPHKL